MIVDLMEDAIQTKYLEQLNTTFYGSNCPLKGMDLLAGSNDFSPNSYFRK